MVSVPVCLVCLEPMPPDMKDEHHGEEMCCECASHFRNDEAWDEDMARSAEKDEGWE